MELDILKQNTTWNDASASINNNFSKVKTAIEQGGGSAAVDTQMSDTSEKAVQNKVIKKYVDDEVEDAKAYSEEMADNAETAAKQYADDNKVAKVKGKQLSTEDFTTTLKQKLDGLTNYDDADVRSAIEELQNSLDAIVNGDATSAIDSIQEILAFLSTITDTQTLAGIVSDLKQYVDDKVASGGGGGLELRELKMSGSADDNAYNLETLELMRENKVLPAMNAGDGTLVPLTYGGNGQFILQVVQMGIEMQMSVTMAGDGSITMSQDVLAPYVLLTSSRVLEWLTKNKMLAQIGSFEPAFAYYQAQFCLIDYYRATTGDNTKAVVQFNYGSQRFERVYDANTGEEISTTEIPLGGGGGSDVDIFPSEYSDEFNDDFTN